MLAKGFRLKRNEDFSKVFRFGRPFFVGLIGCKVLSERNSDTRVGFSFSKKLFPKAAKRNRVKRIFSHVVERNKKFLPDDMNIIFFYGKKPEKIEYKSISRDILEILTNISKTIRK
jgi:ribonuclease P protein component